MQIFTENGTEIVSGEPAVGGHARGVAKYSNFGLVEARISRKQSVITNRKLHTSFRLVPKSVILNDLERRNGRYFALFHRIRYLLTGERYFAPDRFRRAIGKSDRSLASNRKNCPLFYAASTGFWFARESFPRPQPRL